MAHLKLLTLLLAAAGSWPRPVAACTSYIVGPDASADGSVLIARNDDGDGPWFSSSLVHHAAREGPAVLRANLNNLTITLPGPGLAYWSLPAGPLADAAKGTNTTGAAPLLKPCGDHTKRTIKRSVGPRPAAPTGGAKAFVRLRANCRAPPRLSALQARRPAGTRLAWL